MSSQNAQSGWNSAVLEGRTLQAIAKLVHEETGIVVNEEKGSLVQARLTRRLRATNIRNFDDYLDFVRSESGENEFKEMLRSLTTNVTKFNREPHHFSDLRDNVFPKLAESVKSGGKLRIWSAACSTGEEPYSIAMEIFEYFADAERLDVKILATDIDSDVVNKARNGFYSSNAIKALPPSQQKYFPEYNHRSVDGIHRISANVRSIISFNVLNLLSEWPFYGSFDIIFCRNVMIYFDRITQEILLKRFASRARSGTRLYIGHSERLVGPAQDKFRSVGTTSFAYVD